MTALVLVHGFMGGSAQWHLQAPLARARPLVMPDLPGFGANAGSAAAPIERIEEFALWTLDHLSRQGVERFDLLGHSMGGMVVQEMVRQAPERVRRLVLYATGSIGALPGRFEPIETSMARARADGAAATAHRIAATWYLDREAAADYPACAAIAAQTTLPALLAGLRAMRDWSGEEHLAGIAQPTLVIWGDRDRTYPWSQTERLWRTIPDCALAVIPNCAHAVHGENPGLFNRILAEFLDREEV